MVSSFSSEKLQFILHTYSSSEYSQISLSIQVYNPFLLGEDIIGYHYSIQIVKLHCHLAESSTWI